MIGQAILDFFRDAMLNWVDGFNSIIDAAGFSTAGSAVGGAAADAGHFLALFIGAASWGSLVVASATYGAVWGITGLIAIVSRRGTAS